MNTAPFNRPWDIAASCRMPSFHTSIYLCQFPLSATWQYMEFFWSVKHDFTTFQTCTTRWRLQCSIHYGVVAPPTVEVMHNSRGHAIENFLLNSNLCLMNGERYTYIHPAAGSRNFLDLLICNLSLLWYNLWYVNDNLCRGDHFPVMLRQESPTPATPEKNGS